MNFQGIEGFLRKYWKKARRRIFRFPRPYEIKRVARDLGRVLIIYAIGIAVFIYFYDSAYYSGNLDPKLIVSLFFVEVPILVGAYFVLEWKSRKLEAVELAKTALEFAHLKIYRVQDWGDEKYPKEIYYVVNLSTKLAYYASEAIAELEYRKIIERLTYFCEKEVIEEFGKEGFTLIRKTPAGDELDYRKKEIREIEPKKAESYDPDLSEIDEF